MLKLCEQDLDQHERERLPADVIPLRPLQIAEPNVDVRIGVKRLPLGLDYQGRHPEAAPTGSGSPEAHEVPLHSAERRRRLIRGALFIALAVIALACAFADALGDVPAAIDLSDFT